MIPRSSVVELEKKLAAISQHPEFSQKVQKEIVDLMAKEASFHSFMMEVTEGTSSFTDQKLEERFGSADNIKENTWEVWEWAKENYDGTVNEAFLIDIAHKFEPKCNDRSGFRRNNVRLEKMGYLPPRYEKVPAKIGAAIDEINSLGSTIEKALFAHLHIALIQPFNDGNKRTARLVQNIILENGGFPPIIIYGGEKSVYLDMLKLGIEGYTVREKGGAWHVVSDGERAFYRYLLAKEAASLESLYSQLIDRRCYKVTVDYKEKGCMFTLKKVIRNYFLKSRNKGEVKIRGSTLEVNGNISKAKLDELLGCTAGYKSCTVDVVK